MVSDRPTTDHPGLPDQVLGALREAASGGTGGLVVLTIALVGLFALLRPASFLSVDTARSMMFQLPELGLLALAMAVPLISGGLNLAIIATANQAALLMAFVMKAVIASGIIGGYEPVAIALALGAGLALCLLIGLATGFLVAYTGVHPILVTLGTMSIVEGISIYLTRGTVIAGFPASFQMLANATVLGVPVSFAVLVLVFALVALILKRTPFGVSVFMIGSNIEATRYSGIDTRRVLIGVYTLSSLLCWVAGTLMMARFNSASAGYAQSYLLVTILAAVLGGLDPFGGFGRITGLFMGLVVLQVIASGFNLLGLDPQLTLAVWGLTLICVMGVKSGLGSLGELIRQRRAATLARTEETGS